MVNKTAAGDAVGTGGDAADVEVAVGDAAETLGDTGGTLVGTGGTTGATAEIAGAVVVPGGTLRVGPGKTLRVAAGFECGKPEDIPGVIRDDDAFAFVCGITTRELIGSLRFWKVLGPALMGGRFVCDWGAIVRRFVFELGDCKEVEFFPVVGFVPIFWVCV